MDGPLPFIGLGENHEILANDDKCLIKILADYRACHMTYKFKIYSINLMLDDQSQSQIQNPAFWLVNQHQIHEGSLDLIGHVTRSVPSKDSREIDFDILNYDSHLLITIAIWIFKLN